MKYDLVSKVGITSGTLIAESLFNGADGIVKNLNYIPFRPEYMEQASFQDVPISTSDTTIYTNSGSTPKAVLLLGIKTDPDGTTLVAGQYDTTVKIIENGSEVWTSGTISLLDDVLTIVDLNVDGTEDATSINYLKPIGIIVVLAPTQELHISAADGTSDVLGSWPSYAKIVVW